MFGAEIKSLFMLHGMEWKEDMPCFHNNDALKLNLLIAPKKLTYRLAWRPTEVKYKVKWETRNTCMAFSSAVCLNISWFIVLSQSLWCWCPCCCFIARGYSTGFEQWYSRYCGICISFPESPAGQPRAVYLLGYKAASQRVEGKGIGTEVGVKRTGCHCVL